MTSHTKDEIYRTCNASLERYQNMRDDGGPQMLMRLLSADFAAAYVAINEAIGNTPKGCNEAMKILREAFDKTINGIEHDPRWPGRMQ